MYRSLRDISLLGDLATNARAVDIYRDILRCFRHGIIILSFLMVLSSIVDDQTIITTTHHIFRAHNRSMSQEL